MLYLADASADLSAMQCVLSTAVLPVRVAVILSGLHTVMLRNTCMPLWAFRLNADGLLDIKYGEASG